MLERQCTSIAAQYFIEKKPVISRHVRILRPSYLFIAMAQNCSVDDSSHFKEKGCGTQFVIITLAQTMLGPSVFCRYCLS